MTYYIGLIGAFGRMGKAITSCTMKDSSLSLAWKLNSKSSRDSLEKADVIIDFSSINALQGNLDLAIKMQIPIVIGTTGIKDADKNCLQKAALEIPVFWAPNFSLGMAILVHSVKNLSPLLGNKFTPFISETHHVQKKDSPSGSALSIAEATLTGYARTPPIESIRKGEVIGEHSISFVAEGEKLTLHHECISRDVFALGALEAAKFLIDKSPNLYQMKDLIQSS